MADVQTTDINTKPTVTAIDSNDQIYISDGGTALKKISYTNLAKAIIEQYNASQLAGATKTIQTAINDLNSNPYTTLHRYPPTGWSETADLVTEIQRYWTSFPNIKLYACVLALNNVGEVSLLVYRNGNYGTVIANCFAWGESVVLKNMNGTWSKYDVQAEINTLNSKVLNQTVVTGSNAVTTTHTISSAVVLKIGRLVVANIDITATSDIAAWSNFFTIKNTNLASNIYGHLYTDGYTETVLCSQYGQVQGSRAISNGRHALVTLVGVLSS